MRDPHEEPTDAEIRSLLARCGSTYVDAFDACRAFLAAVHGVEDSGVGALRHLLNIGSAAVLREARRTGEIDGRWKYEGATGAEE